MPTSQWTSWLGPAADELTEEQRDRFEVEARLICDRYAGPDLAAEQDVALSALVQYLLGETDLDRAGDARAVTRSAARDALTAAQVVARLAVLDGVPEAEAARRASLDRMTVRKVLGKR